MAFGNSPKNVTGLVAADTEVYRLEGAKVLLPSFLAFPAVRDGIAEEDDVADALALLVAFEELFGSSHQRFSTRHLLSTGLVPRHSQLLPAPVPTGIIRMHRPWNYEILVGKR
jgi:hypothetical protein